MLTRPHQETSKWLQLHRLATMRPVVALYLWTRNWLAWLRYLPSIASLCCRLPPAYGLLCTSRMRQGIAVGDYHIWGGLYQ